jgi:hypothetical protein
MLNITLSVNYYSNRSENVSQELFMILTIVRKIHRLLFKVIKYDRSSQLFLGLDLNLCKSLHFSLLKIFFYKFGLLFSFILLCMILLIWLIFRN